MEGNAQLLIRRESICLALRVCIGYTNKEGDDDDDDSNDA